MKKATCILIVDRKTDMFVTVSKRHDHDDFNLPGGKVNDNETFEEAGVRELEEETGAVVEIRDLIFLYEGTDRTNTGLGGDYTVKTFLTYRWKEPNLSPTNSNGFIEEENGGVVKWEMLENMPYITKTWPEYNGAVLQKYRDLRKLPTFYLQPEGEFYLIKIPTTLDNFYKPIINSILNCKSFSIFSLTLTGKETSIILSKNMFDQCFAHYEMQFPNDFYKSDLYNGLNVTTKNPGLNEIGVLNRLSEKFVQYQIPILNMSTYLGNYVFYPSDKIKDFSRMLSDNLDLAKIDDLFPNI